MDSLARSLADTGLPHPLLVDAAREAIAAGDPGVGGRPGRGPFPQPAAARSSTPPACSCTPTSAGRRWGRRRATGDPRPQPRARPHDGPARVAPVPHGGPPGAGGRRRGGPGGQQRRRRRPAGAGRAGPGPRRWWSAGASWSRSAAASASPRCWPPPAPGWSRSAPPTAPACRDYAAALADDPALFLKVHQSNYRIVGFTESVTVAELVTLGPPVVVDLGSGLLDAADPWLAGRAAAVAGRRAGRPPDPGGRRRPGHLLRRQAPRRSAGRESSPGGPTWSPPAPATPWPGRCARAAWCSAPSRRPPWPTCAATPAAIPFWRMATDRRWQSCAGGRRAVGRRRTGRVLLGRRRRHRCPAWRSRRPASPSPATHRGPPGPRSAGHRPGRRRRTISDLRTRRPGRRPVAGQGALGGSATVGLTVHVLATAGHVDHGKSTLVAGPDRHRPGPAGRGEGSGA